MSAAATMGVMRQLFAAYPNTAAGTETVAMYVRLLADIPPAALQTVIDQAIATCKFLPSISELRDQYIALQRPLTLTWADGWSEVQRQIRATGMYGTPQFADPVTTQVVRSMGWRTLCLSENQVADRAQFRDMYTILAQREETDRRLLPQAREFTAKALPGQRLIGDVA